jgi:hypothetical protein
MATAIWVIGIPCALIVIYDIYAKYTARAMPVFVGASATSAMMVTKWFHSLTEI